MDAPIYEGGGEEAFERWLNAFYDLVEGEEDLAGCSAARERGAPPHVTPWWGEVMGGPARYTDDTAARAHAGQAPWARVHRRPAAALRHAAEPSADLAGLPDEPEFRAALMGYAEWGTRLAVHNSQPGADAAAHAPVPRWGGAPRRRTALSTSRRRRSCSSSRAAATGDEIPDSVRSLEHGAAAPRGVLRDRHRRSASAAAASPRPRGCRAYGPTWC